MIVPTATSGVIFKNQTMQDPDYHLLVNNYVITFYRSIFGNKIQNVTSTTFSHARELRFL